VAIAAGVILALAGLVGVYLVVLRRIFARAVASCPCPRCRRPLGRSAAAAARDYYQLGGRERDLPYACRVPRVVRCPACGAELVFDERGRVMAEFTGDREPQADT
jgi:hypothetical protein